MTQADVFRAMTPEQRLRAALKLIESARQLKAAAIRARHPDWDEARVWRAVRDAFLHARD